MEQLSDVVTKHQVVVVSKPSCPFCRRVLSLLSGYEGIDMVVLDASANPDWQRQNIALTSQRTVPSVFVNGKHIGGCDDTTAVHSNGTLGKMLSA